MSKINNHGLVWTQAKVCRVGYKQNQEIHVSCVHMQERGHVCRILQYIYIIWYAYTN